MAFENQSGSWFSGNNLNSNPQFAKCVICRGKHGPNHFAENCPEAIFQQYQFQMDKQGDNCAELPYQMQGSSCQLENQVSNPEKNLQSSSWNSPMCNQGESWNDSSQKPPLDSLPSSNSKVGKQEEATQNYTEKLIAMMNTILQSSMDAKVETDKALVQHKELILALAQANSSSAEIITAQAKKIEKLEETVDKLGTRVQIYQKQQSKEHMANLRRIKQITIEVNNLRTQCARMDSRLCCPLQREKVSHCQPYFSDSSDEEEIEVINLETCSSGEHKLTSSTEEKAASKLSTEEKLASSDELPQLPTLRTESFQATSSNDLDSQVNIPNEAFTEFLTQLWEKMQGQLDDEELQQLKKIAQTPLVNNSSPTPQVLSNKTDSNHQDWQIMRLRRITAVESSSGGLNEESEATISTSELEKKIHTCEGRYPNPLPKNSEISITPPKRTCENSGSCSGCGLKCQHQLRACVNMIKVQPSLIKVKEAEIRKMKSKQKRKLQRKWVPHGIFDIQELLKIDHILKEEQCAKLFMPRWRKRQRQKPPEFCDTHD